MYCHETKLIIFSVYFRSRITGKLIMQSEKGWELLLTCMMLVMKEDYFIVSDQTLNFFVGF